MLAAAVQAACWGRKQNKVPNRTAVNKHATDSTKEPPGSKVTTEMPLPTLNRCWLGAGTQMPFCVSWSPHCPARHCYVNPNTLPTVPARTTYSQ